MTLIEELRDFAERLAQSRNPDPQVSQLLNRAADALEEAEDDVIVICDSNGEEILTLDSKTSAEIYEIAVKEFVEKSLHRLIEEHQN